MLPNYFYNNNYTIVQTTDNVMILTEMVHDTRVVRMGGTHPPPSFRQWFGDSIGRWDGDTLVIETTNFHPNHGFRGSWENLKVTERIARKDAGTLSYRFIVEDATTFTAPFSGALEFRALAPYRIVLVDLDEGFRALGQGDPGPRRVRLFRPENGELGPLLPHPFDPGERAAAKPLADAVTISTGTGASLPGSAARSAATRLRTASCSCGLLGARFEPEPALAL
jgi:hypothetical protein